MSRREEVQAGVCRHLENIAQPEQGIHAQTNIAEQFALDSVKVLDLLMELEDEFDISVPLNLMADVQTVEDLTNVIYGLVSEK